jgi:tetratricopeptide (TPR) repeat protein
MKGKKLVRTLMMTVLVAGWTAGWTGGGAMVQAQQAAAQPAPQWKDRAEYDQFIAITTAASKPDNAQVIELTDKYLAGYPDSKQLSSIYQLRMQAYQGLNNTPKMEEAANKVLEIDPGNLRALLLLSYLFPRTINTADPELDKKLGKAGENAQKALAALDALPAPPGVTPEQFQQQKNQSAAVLHQTAGYVALQKKDYSTAQQELIKSSTASPNDALGFYWLGLSYMGPKPAEYDKGMWALARATALTGPTALPESMKGSVKDYLDKVYDARHGSTDGLSDLTSKAAATAFPQDGFHVQTAEELAPPEPEPAPPPPPKRELTVKPEELSDFSVIVKYLQAGGEKEADTWELLKGQTDFALPGKVVSATPAAKPTKILLAVSPELQLPAAAGKHDVELTLAAPYSKAIPAGTSINFAGTIDSYTAKPFNLKMVDGKITP